MPLYSGSCFIVFVICVDVCHFSESDFKFWACGGAMDESLMTNQHPVWMYRQFSVCVLGVTAAEKLVFFPCLPIGFGLVNLFCSDLLLRTQLVESVTPDIDGKSHTSSTRQWQSACCVSVCTWNQKWDQSLDSGCSQIQKKNTKVQGYSSVGCSLWSSWGPLVFFIRSSSEFLSVHLNSVCTQTEIKQKSASGIFYFFFRSRPKVFQLFSFPFLASISDRTCPLHV